MPETSQSIIVPLDGSALAAAAIPFAIALAQRRHADIDLVHVHSTGVRTQNAPIVDPRWDTDRSKDMGDAIRVLGERYARETGVSVSVTVLRGEPAAMLMNYATEQEPALVAMTTHGRSGFSHAWFGSVTEHVVHASPVPVLVIRTGEHVRADITGPLFRHILLPIEHGANGSEALAHALALGTPGVTRYTLLMVVSAYHAPMPAPLGSFVVEEIDHVTRVRDDAHTLLEQIAAAPREDGADIATRVVTADPVAPAILAQIEPYTDLIVLPTRRRNAFSRALLGSVADKVMRGSTVPIFTFGVT